MSSQQKQSDTQTNVLDEAILSPKKVSSEHQSFWSWLVSLFYSKNTNPVEETDVEQHSSSIVQSKKEEEIKPIAIVIDPLFEKASQFLASSNFDLFFNMVKNGYLPHKQQKELFNNYIFSRFRYNNRNLETWDEVEHYLSYGFELTNDFILSFIHDLFSRCLSETDSDSNLSLEFLVDSQEAIKLRKRVFYFGENNSEDFHSYPLITAQIRKHTQAPDFLANTFHQMTKAALRTLDFEKRFHYSSQDDSEKVLKNILQNHASLLLRDITFDEFLHFIEEGSQSVQFDRVFYNDIMKKIYHSDIQKFMTYTKDNHSLEYVKNITAQQIQQHNVPANLVLPDNAKKLIEQISILYQKIQSHLNKAGSGNNESGLNKLENAQMIFEVTNLFEKRLPEILKKYLTIDEEYRETLTNSQGLNAQQLMISSLENIQANLATHWETLNQNNVDALSVSKRYTEHFNPERK